MKLALGQQAGLPRANCLLGSLTTWASNWDLGRWQGDPTYCGRGVGVQLKRLTVPWPERFVCPCPRGCGWLVAGLLVARSPGTFTMAPNSVQSMQRPVVAYLREKNTLIVLRKEGSPQGLGLQTFHANAYLSPGAKISHLELAPSTLRQEPGIVESSKGQATYKV